MRVGCPACRTVHDVDERTLPPSGLEMQCASCASRFLVRQPAPAAGPVPLPGGGASPPVVPPAGSIPLPAPPGGAPPSIPLPGAPERQAAPPPSGGSLPSIPLPGAAAPAGGGPPSIPLPGPVPLPSADPFGAAPPPREPTPSPGIDFDLSLPPREPTPSPGLDFDLSLPPDAAANPFAEPPPARERTPTPTPAFDFDLSLPPAGADGPALDEFGFGGDAPDEVQRPTPTAEYGLGPSPDAPGGQAPPSLADDLGLGAEAPLAFDAAFDFEAPQAEPAGFDLTIPPLQDDDGLFPAPPGSVEDDLRAFLGGPVLPPPPQQIVPATVGVVGKHANEPIFHVRRQTGKRIGPFDRDTLIRLVRQDQLDGTEEISETGEEWMPLSGIPEVAQLLEVRPPEQKRSRAPMLQPMAKKGDDESPAEEGELAQEAPAKPASRWLAKPVKTVSREDLEEEKSSSSYKRLALIAGGALLAIAIPAAAFLFIGGGDGAQTGFAADREARLAQIRAALLRDNFAATQDALAIATELVQASPEDQLALALQARSSFAMKRRFDAGGVGPEMARDKLQQLPPERKEEPAWRMAAAAASFTFAKSFEHKAWLEEQAQTNPRDPEPVALLAEGSHRVGDLKGAGRWYAKLLEIVPNSPLALHGLASLQVEKGELESAAANFEKALQADPQHAASALALAGLASERGDDAEAMRQLDRALGEEAIKGLGNPARTKAHLDRARLLLRSQQPAVAEEALLQALAADPRSREAQLLLVRLWNARGKEAETIKLLAAPDAKPDGAVLAELVQAYLAIGRTSEPTLLVQPLLKPPVKTALPHFLQGRIEEASDKEDAAAASFAKALEIEPKHLPSMVALARRRAAAGDLEGARSLLDAAKEAAPKSAEPGLALGDVLLLAKNPAGALEAFESAAALDPVSELAEVGRGRALEAGGAREAAQVAYQRALELNPDSAEVQFAWGTYLWRACGGAAGAQAGPAICAPVVQAAAREGDPDAAAGQRDAGSADAGAEADGEVAAADVAEDSTPEGTPSVASEAEVLAPSGRVPALVALEKARRLAPSRAPILRALGAVQLDLGLQEDALASLTQALTLDNDSGEGHYLRSKILLAKNDLRTAQTAIERALSLDPGNAALEMQAGRVLEAMGNQAEALAAYRRALAQRPDFLEALEGQGRTLLAMGASAEAVRSFEAALAFSPDRVRLLVQIGDIHARARGQRKAISTYEEAEKLGATGLAFRQARAHLDLGNTNKAIVLLRRAVQEDPENADAWRFLGYAYKEKNNRGDAREAFRTYLERDPEAKDRDEILDEIAGLR